MLPSEVFTSQLREIVQDNMPVTRRIKESAELFCLHPRFKDSLSVFSSFQVYLFIRQVGLHLGGEALASAEFNPFTCSRKEADINMNVPMVTSDRAEHEIYFPSVQHVTTQR